MSYALGFAKIFNYTTTGSDILVPEIIKQHRTHEDIKKEINRLNIQIITDEDLNPLVVNSTIPNPDFNNDGITGYFDISNIIRPYIIKLPEIVINNDLMNPDSNIEIVSFKNDIMKAYKIIDINSDNNTLVSALLNKTLTLQIIETISKNLMNKQFPIYSKGV